MSRLGYLLLLLVIVALTILVWGLKVHRTLNTPEPKVAVTATSTPNKISSPEPSSSSVSSPVAPMEVNLEVPFTTQAPGGNWDSVHEELCEEASLFMAQWYVLGKKGQVTSNGQNIIPAADTEKAFDAMVAWQENEFGLFESTTADQTAKLAKGALGLSLRSLAEPTAEDMKRELRQGNLVIVPAAGRELHNPYFTPPGPSYHMLVVRGYNDKGFITNDPGTRHGQGYIYSEATVLESIHDWTGDPSTITSGKRVVLVVTH